MFNNPRSCLYERLDSRVHQYTFRESSRRAVTEFTNLLSHLVIQSHPAGQIPVLLDIRQSGLPPVVHMQSQLKTLFSVNSAMPSLRVAVIYRAGSLLSVTGSFIIPQRPQDTVRMFQDDADAALAWLRIL